MEEKERQNKTDNKQVDTASKQTSQTQHNNNTSK